MIKEYKKYYFGIDVGGTAIKYGVFGQNAKEEKKLITKFSIRTTVRKRNAEKEIVKEILDAIVEFCHDNNYGVKINKVKGIGFAIPGPVVNNNVIKAVNINWKKKYNIVSATKKRLGKKVNVAVLNDGNAAALGEYKYNLKSKYKSICLMTLGTAVGIGIIINDKLIEGKTGVAGELSHLKVDFSNDAIKCNCGNVGCLETVTGGKGIANIYRRLYKDDPEIDAQKIISLAKDGDLKALNALEHSLDYLSQVIAIIMLVYEPEVILIGGGVSNAGKFILDIIKKHLKGKVFITKMLPKIQIAKLKNDAGMYGVVAEL